MPCKKINKTTMHAFYFFYLFYLTHTVRAVGGTGAGWWLSPGAPLVPSADLFYISSALLLSIQDK